MREDPDGLPSSSVRLRRRLCSLSDIYYELVFSTQRFGGGGDKVMAGGTPANPAALVVVSRWGWGSGAGAGVGIGVGLGPGARLTSSTSNTSVELAGMVTTFVVGSVCALGP